MQPSTTAAAPTALPAALTPNPKRWWILALVFLSITINYLDRTMLGILRPVIGQDIGLGDEVYGNITTAFLAAYALGSLICGGVLDKVGTRIGLAAATALWSVSAMLHGTVTSAGMFATWRAGLGIGEGAGFPSANKATAEWFPVSERAFAAGIFTAATNFSVVIGPLLFVGMAQALGWRACFFIIGALGFLWIAPWLMAYKLPQITPQIAKPKGISMLAVMGYKQAWGYGIAKFLTDATWFFLLFWLPSYFTNVLNQNLNNMAIGMTFVYLVSGVGAVVGGWVAGSLMKSGMAPGKARKLSMLVFALLMLPSGLAVVVDNLYAIILLFTLAATAHQAWMANLFSTTGDVFPARAVGVTNGFGGALGAIGGALGSGYIPGQLIPLYGYAPIFIAMVCTYLIALAAVHFLMGPLEQITLHEEAA
jgi:ACS family hexuronate transporter-like MFS transporter